MTTISNIQIKATGPNSNLTVKVVCDIKDRDGCTPQVTFPGGVSVGMTNIKGDQWEASDTEQYDGSEKSLTIVCGDAQKTKKFKS